MSNQIIIPSKRFFKHDHVIDSLGHRTPYLYIKHTGVVDGIGRQHVNLYGRCDICNKEIIVARLHVNEDGIIYPALKK